MQPYKQFAAEVKAGRMTQGQAAKEIEAYIRELATTMGKMVSVYCKACETEIYRGLKKNADKQTEAHRFGDDGCLDAHYGNVEYRTLDGGRL